MEIEVIDGATFQPLPGASVALNGKYLGQADSSGFFNINAAETDMITVSYVGYDPFSMQGGLVTETGQVQLSRTLSQLPAVLITPSRGSAAATNNMWPVIILGGLGIAMLSGKRKVSGIGKNPGKSVALAALGVGAAYLFLKKKTPSGGILPTGSQFNAQTAAAQQRAAQLQSSKSTSAASLLSQGSSIFSTIKSFFGGSPSPGGPSNTGTPVVTPDANFTAVDAGIDTTQQSPAIDPAMQAPGYIDPASGMQLSFPDQSQANMPMDYSINMDGTAMAGIDTTHLLVPALIIGGGLLLFKKKKVGAAADYSKYIIPAGLLVGGYFVLKNFNLFGGPSKANAQVVSSTSSASIQEAIDKEKAAGGFLTYDAANYASWANDIFTKGLISPIDQDSIVSDIIQANTLLDLLTVKKWFGTREANTGSWLSLCAVAQFNCTTLDFDSFVKLALDSAHINKVNGYLNDQNINYHF